MKKFHTVLLSMLALMCAGLTANAENQQTLVVDDPAHYTFAYESGTSYIPAFEAVDGWYEAKIGYTTQVTPADGFKFSRIEYDWGGGYSDIRVDDIAAGIATSQTVTVNDYSNGEKYRFTAGATTAADDITLTIVVPEGKTPQDYVRFCYVDSEMVQVGNLKPRRGNKIDFYLDQSERDNTAVKWNGEYRNYDYTISVVVAESENVLEFIRLESKTVNVTLTVDNPEAVTVRGGDYGELGFDADGSMSLSSDTLAGGYATVKAVEPSQITSVTCGARTVAPDAYDSNYYVLSLKDFADGDVIAIATETPVVETATVYIDDTTPGLTYKLVDVEDPTHFYFLTSGEITSVSFLSTSRSFLLTKYYADDLEGEPTYFYRNGEADGEWGWVENMSINTGEYAQGSFVYIDYTGYLYFGEITFADGDEVRVYSGEKPSWHTVTVTFDAEGATANVVVDRVHPVADFAPMSLISGSEVAISAADGGAIYGVTANGAAVDFNTGRGAYILRVKADTDIKVSTVDPLTSCPYTLSVDDPSHVDVALDYEMTQLLSPMPGTNTYVIELNADGVAGNNDDQCTVFVRARDGYIIRSVLSVADGEQKEETVQSPDYFTTSYSLDNFAKKSVSITTADLTGLRTAYAYFTVDDLTGVSILASYTGVDIAKSLTAGEMNFVRFIPGEESHLKVFCQDGSLIYRVTVNGTAVAPQGDAYYFDIADGDNVVVTRTVPQGSVPLSINFVNPGTEAFITSVEVDGQPVESVSGSIEVAIGSHVCVYGSDAFKFVAIDVNGTMRQEGSWYGCFEFDILDDKAVTVNVEAVAWTYYGVTVKVADPSYITVRIGDAYIGDIVPLTGPETTFSVREDISKLVVKGTGKAPIERVKADNYIIGSDFEGCYNVTGIKDGTVIEVATGTPPENLSMMVYFDSPAKASAAEQGLYGYELSHRGVQTSYTLEAGYNDVEFTLTGYPLAFLLKGNLEFDAPNRYLYIDNVMQGASFSYDIPEEPGIVVKMYVTTVRPKFGEVNITIDNPEKAPVVVVDRINTLEAMPAAIAADDGSTLLHSFNALPGTEVRLTPADDAGNTLRITVDGTEIEAGEDGSYLVTVNGDTDVKVSTKGSAIIDLNAAYGDDSAAVYTLQGIRVNAKVGNLKPGIYVIDGKKTLIK